jgi:Ras-related protein Rab-23
MALVEETDMETSLKIIVVGNGQVGKTSLATRYAKGVMTDNYKKTIGTDFMEKDLILKGTGETVKLMLWDTAGQEMFSELTRQYYRGAGAVIYVFSTTDRESFNEIERWRGKVQTECGDIVSVLVQNKIDMLEKAEMRPAEVEDLAKRISTKLYRVCVKDNIQVDDVFEYVADQYLKRGAVESDTAVSDIKEGSSTNKKPDNSKSEEKVESKRDSNGSSPVTTASTDMSANSNTNSTNNGTGKSFQLNNSQPSKQRTGGKKKGPCVIM